MIATHVLDGLLALLQVMVIDLALAGDNALVIGALAARLPQRTRARAITIGIAVAIATRLLFSVAASWLLMIPAIGVIGGALLLWIAWKLWQDQADNGKLDASHLARQIPAGFVGAVRAIVVADISMSLDNVLGVAAAAEGHIFALVIGLILSMALMGAAASWIAAQMQRRPWLVYLGIAAIVLAALQMIYGAVF